MEFINEFFGKVVALVDKLFPNMIVQVIVYIVATLLSIVILWYIIKYLIRGIIALIKLPFRKGKHQKAAHAYAAPSVSDSCTVKRVSTSVIAKVAVSTPIMETTNESEISLVDEPEIESASEIENDSESALESSDMTEPTEEIADVSEVSETSEEEIAEVVEESTLVESQEEPSPADQAPVIQTVTDKDQMSETVTEDKKELTEVERKHQERLAKAIALAAEERELAEKERRKEERDAKRKAKEAEEERVRLGYDGKWEIVKDNDFYRFKLRASNGGLLCTSEGYTSKVGCKAGIATFTKSVQGDHFNIYEDKSGVNQIKFFTDNGRLILVGETYTTRQGAQSAVESMKRFTASAKLVDLTKDEKDTKSERKEPVVKKTQDKDAAATEEK